MKLVKFQRGLSLVELMIGITLGLLLMAGAVQVMLSSSEVFRATDGQSRIQENGRFAMDFLTQSVRMAGYRSSENTSTNGNVVFNGACGGFDPCTENDADVYGDRIGIILDPSNDLDCLGNAVGATDVILNVFYLDDADGDAVSSLYCRGFNINLNTWFSAAQPLVDGVESLQMLYGLSDPASNNEINRYVSANDVVDWANVGAVRVSFLTNNGQNQGQGDTRSRSFKLLDAAQLTFNDKHERQIYTSTIAVNNIIYLDSDLNQ